MNYRPVANWPYSRAECGDDTGDCHSRARVQYAGCLGDTRSDRQSTIAGVCHRGSFFGAGTHFTEVIKKYACELFSRQEAKRVLDRVGQDQPKLVEDLVPKQLTLAAVQKIFQNLLRERVAIKDAETILEAMSEGSAMTRNIGLLTEYVRQAIRRSIVKPHLNMAGDLPAYFLESQIEQIIEGAIEHGEHNSHFALSPQQVKSVVDKLTQALLVTDAGVAVITSSGARCFLKQMTENALPFPGGDCT